MIIDRLLEQFGHERRAADELHPAPPQSRSAMVPGASTYEMPARSSVAGDGLALARRQASSSSPIQGSSNLPSSFRTTGELSCLDRGNSQHGATPSKRRSGFVPDA